MTITASDVLRLAAFCDGDTGGNPAGVAIVPQFPADAVMRALAADIAYSETAFATPVDGAWRVRYFSPESEVPFCGHATIALGAALAERQGDGTFTLQLNEATIPVSGRTDGERYSATLQSPPTTNRLADESLVNEALALFGYTLDDLDSAIPPLVVSAGATHLILGLRTRQALAAMHYDLADGRTLMNDAALVTIALVHARADGGFDVRNAFASGGVLEDPATGAAAAAFAGALRDRGLRAPAPLTLIQGEDMGARSIIVAEASGEPGSAVQVSGMVRTIR